MQSYLLTELVDIEKREEPRQRCSVYVNFSNGHQIATARILDYSDSGFRMRTSGKAQLGRTIEILDTEHSTFESRFGRVVWQRLLKDGSREFGVHLIRQPEKLTVPSSPGIWETLQQLAIEEAFA